MVANFSPFLFWLVLTGCLAIVSPVLAGLTVAAAVATLVHRSKR
ncbi:hypothetical protein ACFXPA_44420 [Amycolatopsis sp. NPDC059090]